MKTNLALFCALLMTGCITVDSLKRAADFNTSLPEIKEEIEAEPPVEEEVTTPVASPDVIDVIWHGVDVGKFKVKYDLKVSIKGSKIIYDQIATSKWPSQDYKVNRKQPDGSVKVVVVKVCGNPYIIMRLKDGKLHGFNHEWMRPGQKIKNLSSVAGDHIKVFGLVPKDWKLSENPGQYYFCITSLARGGRRSVDERTELFPLVTH